MKIKFFGFRIIFISFNLNNFSFIRNLKWPYNHRLLFWNFSNNNIIFNFRQLNISKFKLNIILKFLQILNFLNIRHNVWNFFGWLIQSAVFIKPIFKLIFLNVQTLIILKKIHLSRISIIQFLIIEFICKFIKLIQVWLIIRVLGIPGWFNHRRTPIW